MTAECEKRLRIVFIAGGVHVPATRFRVRPVEEAALSAGHAVRSIYGYGRLDSKIRMRFVQRAYRLVCRLIRAVRTIFVSNADVVFVQRLALPFWSGPERILAWRGVPVVFDFDDAVDLAPNWKPSWARTRALHKMFESADRIIAGNSWLAQKTGGGMERTVVVPTTIDVDTYRPSSSKYTEASLPVVGWIGTSSNFTNLREIEPVIKELRRRGIRFTFKIVSEMKDRRLIGALDAEFSWWSKENEIETLQGFDIGIMPLVDSDWSRGKCGFKLIQYMAVGIPVVASSVGFNRDVVDHERSGFLAETESQWLSYLAALIQDPALRKAIGNRARRRAEERFSTQVWAPRVLSIIESAAESGRR